MHTRHAAKMTAPGCLGGLLAAGAFLLVITPARAQPADPRESQSRSDCLAGRFQAGVDLLSQLFVETGDANYIYNQGRCYEQNGKFTEAILRFREFLRKAKDLSAEEKAEVNGHIAECQTMKAEQDGTAVPAAAVPVKPPGPVTPATPLAPATPPTPAKPPAEAQIGPPVTNTPAPPAATEATTPVGLVVAAPSQPSLDSKGVSLRTAGIVTGSMGAAALIAGVIFGIETHNVANDMTSDAAHRSYSRTTYDRGKLFESLQWVGYGAGAAALAAGGAMYYLGHRAAHPPASDSVSLLPMPLPGGTGAVLQGSF